MSREVCKHGVEITQFEEGQEWHTFKPCQQCISEGALELSKQYEEEDRIERRAEWIRTNAACFFDGNDIDESVKLAEQMADELIKRGHL
jgi:hypothetical protein